MREFLSFLAHTWPGKRGKMKKGRKKRPEPPVSAVIFLLWTGDLFLLSSPFLPGNVDRDEVNKGRAIHQLRLGSRAGNEQPSADKKRAGAKICYICGCCFLFHWPQRGDFRGGKHFSYLFPWRKCQKISGLLRLSSFSLVGWFFCFLKGAIFFTEVK